MKAGSFTVENKEVANSFFAKLVLRHFVGKLGDRIVSRGQFEGYFQQNHSLARRWNGLLCLRIINHLNFDCSRVLSIFIGQGLRGRKWASDNACWEMAYSGV